MKLHLIVIIASSLIVSSAMALAHNGDADDPIEQSKESTVTRAEVIADLTIFRESGLLALDRNDSVDPSSAEYKAAEGRYEKLREATRAAQTAQHHENSREATVVASKPKSVDQAQQ
ncbi:MAG: DUF4148 domain-containing protein [Burkholderiaceae bacterium]|nr:DUF4148 domain-containing protein [Burkholderiaceae bacterium]